VGAEGEAATVSATYDEQDRLLTYGNASYTYTANGELATKTVGAQTTSYAYDTLGNLLQVTQPNGDVITYTVDGRGRRLAKAINGARVKAWLYADQLRPIAELDGTGQIVARFVYGSRANVPDYVTTNGETYRIFSDHLGSPRVIVHAQTGVVVQRMDFHAFGETIQDSNPGWQPFGFAGGLYDPDTGLIRFGARDYDPQAGRWTTKDPILFRGRQTNIYSYSAADPVNFSDPSGLVPVDVVLDVVYILQDAYTLVIQNVLDNCGNLVENVTVLWLDVLGAAVPYGSGFGKAYRAAKHYSDDAAALIDLAKKAKRRGGLSQDEAKILLEWANEYGVEPALDHTGTDHWVGGDHIRIGPINHIPVRRR
jgi:RHS repeat-associated protein